MPNISTAKPTPTPIMDTISGLMRYIFLRICS